MGKDFPNSIDIQKDINDFLSQKYGGKVILSNPSVEGGEEGVPGDTEEAPSHYDFDLKPIELESYLKEYIVEQSEAIETIATKICTHFNRMAYEEAHPECDKIVGGIKGNMLMIGPTGVGKTYMIKLIAEKLGVPFVKGDATKFTETGYVGGDVEDLIRDLVHEADGNIELAEYGIVYLDEVDKIASTGNQFGPDVSRSGVQRNLLKVLEETEVDLKNPMDIASQMEAAMQAQKTGHVERKRISTKNILFVMSGAFQGLTDIIRKRLNAQTLGFSFDEKEGSNDKENWLEHVAKQDLIDYGFESEFVGRLPVIAVLNELGVDGLYKILANPKSSVILGKKRDFSAYDIHLDFEDKALKKIASIAHLEKTGARSLVSVLEKLLIKFEKYLPSTAIKKLVVTEELVADQEKVLRKLLAVEAVKRITEEFSKDHGIQLNFTADALNFIQSATQKTHQSSYDFIHKRLQNYEYGLKLLGRSDFQISKDLLENYQRYLDDLIKKSYDDEKKDATSS